MSRAVSTVVDVAVCLLLVSASVLVLVTAPAPADPAPDRADETADVVASATATVHYSLRPAGESGFVLFPNGTYGRTTRDTVANLLAAAAVRDAELDGEPFPGRDGTLGPSVANATDHALRTVVDEVQVRATWTPYRGAPLSGTVVVGDAPPPTARVHAATLVVPSGMPSAGDRARAVANRSGYDAVASLTAKATVRGLLPPERTSLALASDGPTGVLVRYRYAEAAEQLDANVTAFVATDAASDANERLAARLADTFAADMAARFDSPQAAADAVRVGTVRVVVRTWSP